MAEVLIVSIENSLVVVNENELFLESAADIFVKVELSPILLSNKDVLTSFGSNLIEDELLLHRNADLLFVSLCICFFYDHSVLSDQLFSHIGLELTAVIGFVCVHAASHIHAADIDF